MKQYILIVVIMFCAGGLYAIKAPAKLPSLGVSDGEVQSGIWNSNVSAVEQKAKETHVPALIVYAKRGCPHCARLMASMTNDMFVAWQKDRNLLMGIYHKNRPTIRVGNAGSMNRNKDKPSLFREISSSGVTAPVVCVYWFKADGSEVKRIFSGTRGNMLGQKCDKLEDELTKAVDSVIDGYKSEISPQKTNLQKKEVSK